MPHYTQPNLRLVRPDGSSEPFRPEPTIGQGLRELADAIREATQALLHQPPRVGQYVNVGALQSREGMEAESNPEPTAGRTASGPAAAADAGVRALLSQYEQYLAAREFSEGHISRTMRVLRDLAVACGWEKPADIDRASLIEQLTLRITTPHLDPSGREKKPRTIVPKTADNKAGQMVTFCEWLTETGRLRENPLKNLPKFNRNPDVMGRGKRGVPRVATTEEVRALVAVAEADENRPLSRFNAHRSTLYVFLAHTSLRIGAAAQLTWADLKLDDITPHVLLPSNIDKSRRRRDIPLTTELAAKLISMRSLRKPGITELVFGDVHERVFEGDREAAGIPKRTADGPISFHSLRKWTATTLAEEDVGEGLTAEIMGHASPTTTAQYYRRNRLARRSSAVSQLPILNGVIARPQKSGAESPSNPLTDQSQAGQDLDEKSTPHTPQQPTPSTGLGDAANSPVGFSFQGGIAPPRPVVGGSESRPATDQSFRIAGVGFEPTTAVGILGEILRQNAALLRLLERWTEAGRPERPGHDGREEQRRSG